MVSLILSSVIRGHVCQGEDLPAALSIIVIVVVVLRVSPETLDSVLHKFPQQPPTIIVLPVKPLRDNKLISVYSGLFPE